MTTDAVIAVIGPARTQRWMFQDPAGCQAARRAEQHLVENLEHRLTRQLGTPVRLTAPLVPQRLAVPDPATDAGDGTGPAEPPLALPVGHGEGLATLQAAVLAAVLQQRFDASRALPDPTGPRRQAGAIGYDGALARYRHLLDHHPRAGFYLPLDFPEPIELSHRGEPTSFGSAPRLRTELATWRQEVAPYIDRTSPEASAWLGAHADNLGRMAQIAVQQGLALELY